MEEIREFEIPKNKIKLEADVKCAEALKHRLSVNTKPNQFQTMFMASIAIFMNFDPIFMWIAVFVAITIAINAQPNLNTRLSPTIFLGVTIIRYMMIIYGKAPIYDNFFPPLFKK